MAHPNDTLQGKLLAWELEDEKHLRHKFGYWRMVEKRMIRAQLVEEGFDLNDWTIDFEISKRVTANHKNDPTLREMQEAARAAAPAQPIKSGVWYTQEELERLAEHFLMANDPVAQEIYRKAVVGLEAMGVKP